MKRLNGKGCLAALTVGFLVGGVQARRRHARHLKVGGFEAGYAEGSLLSIVNNIYFQYTAC